MVSSVDNSLFKEFMQLHTYLWQLGLYTEVRDAITHALLMGCPVLEQSPQHLRVLHPIAGLTLIELKEGKPARASNPLFNQPKLSHLVKGFPIRIVHSAFSLPPVEVLMEMSVSPLLAQVPSFFDQYEIGSSGQSRVVEFKSKQSDRMPLDLIRKDLALGVSRTWRDTLLEQLMGTREVPDPFEILGSEEPQPIEKPSIKSRLLSGLVA